MGLKFQSRAVIVCIVVVVLVVAVAVISRLHPSPAPHVSTAAVQFKYALPMAAGAGAHPGVPPLPLKGPSVTDYLHHHSAIGSSRHHARLHRRGAQHAIARNAHGHGHLAHAGGVLGGRPGLAVAAAGGTSAAVPSPAHAAAVAVEAEPVTPLTGLPWAHFHNVLARTLRDGPLSEPHPRFAEGPLPAYLENTAIITMATGDDHARLAVALVQSLREVHTRVPHVVVLLSRGGIGSKNCQDYAWKKARHRENVDCFGPHTIAPEIISEEYIEALTRLKAEVLVIDPIPDTPFTVIPG